MHAHYPINKSIILLLAALFTFSASAYIGPKPPEPDRLWLALLPVSPIQDFTQYNHHVRPYQYQTLEDTPDLPLHLEFREKETQKVIRIFPYTYRDSLFESRYKSPQAIEKLKSETHHFPEGRYLVAITLHGKRCSNVMEFQILNNPKIDKLPVIDLVALEPPPFYELPLLGVRATGSDALKTPFKAASVFEAEIQVDDEIRNSTFSFWGGANPEIRLGDQWVDILDICGFRTPIIQPGIPHTLHYKLNKYSAGPIDFNPGTPLGDAWDNATN